MYVDVWETRVERLDELDVKVKLNLWKISFDPNTFFARFPSVRQEKRLYAWRQLSKKAHQQNVSGTICRNGWVDKN